MALFRPLILCYHAVSDAWNDPLATPVAHFEQQLQTLVERGFRGASAEEVLRRPAGRRLLHVTFDDAFRSVQNAVPILERLQLPATVFACAGLAGSGQPLRVPELQRVEQVDELATLDWDSLRAVAHGGLIEIGSHTVSHAHLTRLADDDLRDELRESRAAIERELGRPCGFLAYPYGEHDQRVREAVRSAGYLAAFAAPGSSIGFDFFQVPRTAFWRNDSRARCAAKTRFPIRLARELKLTPRRRSVR
jgi:peptidoglycan/xylan/chitin deacetylase (PgdA/CDA1 family)